jgi:predicted nucleic acid-binding protein
VKLADVNLLVALSDESHPHFTSAVAWRKKNRLATCPITELGVVRVMMILGASPEDALQHLANVKADADFIPCDAPGSVLAGKVTSHKQTTDVYLVELAARHKGKLCTLDMGIKGAELVK